MPSKKESSKKTTSKIEVFEFFAFKTPKMNKKEKKYLGKRESKNSKFEKNTFKNTRLEQL